MGDTILSDVSSAANHAFNSLSSFTHTLFFILCVIQIVMVIVLNFLSQRDNLIGELMKMVFVIAFFNFILLNIDTFALQFLQGVLALGRGVSGQSFDFTPSGVMNMGLNWAGVMMDQLSNIGFTHVVTGFLILTFSFFILIIMAFITADVAVTYAKYYVLIALSGVMLALSPLESTRPIAINVLKAFIGVLLQLLTLFVLLAIFVDMSANWSGAIIKFSEDSANIGSILVIPAELVVFYMLVKTVPPFIAGLTQIHGFETKGEKTVAMAAGGAGIAAKAVSNPTGLLTGGAVNTNMTQMSANLMKGMPQAGQTALSTMTGGGSQLMTETAKSMGTANTMKLTATQGVESAKSFGSGVQEFGSQAAEGFKSFHDKLNSALNGRK